MKVGVYGGGRMGAGIAHAFLLTGAEVDIAEASEAAAEAARDRVATSLAKAAQRQAIPGGAAPEELLTHLTVGSDPAVLCDAEVIVEAVPEDAALKKTVLQTCSQQAPDAWLASNTSSLSITELAAALPSPERLIGLHFFNPVPASELVEIVVGKDTAPELVEQATGWVQQLGKTAITVQDSPGFASSRLGVFLALEAMRMVQDGVASAADVDTAMTLGYRHPTGPLRTTDIVGLDVRLAIAEHLARELGDRFEPPQILRDKVAAGELGRKSGKGFYQW
ncbi:3-hydroxyacyl-CoA dehydrogenase [Branchiibius hedensis]|uniref:3-hydroxyacyl-CoA dehydrogenase n=1 Tax=Branchiibius hedensis TaxID=672460 RepID=A0A2Y9A1F7_9MICO|nr:3-hydroxyacyl-CoA dehydrogenase family protein [Branchiibius hedensis]PWJ27216.1 3-hydroxyacyl-CoA dehydrogenase [Branchiibius hedensis]SSA36027.1 3-hydroxyacyl-CoA dehydrogenase [Branchiibius hedensis]